MTPWWTDPVQLRTAIETHGNPTSAAKALGGVNARTVQRQWKLLQQGKDLRPDRSTAARARRSGPPKAAGSAPSSRPPDTGELARSKVTDSKLELTSAANPQDTASLTPEEAIERATGRPAAEWHYQFIKNQWDVLVGRDPDTGEAQVSTMHQLKVMAQRRPEAFFAFELPPEWRPPVVPRSLPGPGKPYLIAVFSDPHAPRYQRELVDAQCAWLEEFQPQELYNLGDAADNSPFGRHGRNRRTESSVKDAVWKTTELLLRYAHASPSTRRVLLFGNHDYWLTKRVLEVFPNLMELTRFEEDKPHLAMSTILKLDEIGWEYHETDGEYHDVNIEIAPSLVGMHGTRTGPKGGAVAEFAKWEGASIVQGHDHTLAMLAIRKRLPGGGYVQRYAVSAGSSADPDLGYDPTHAVGQGWPAFVVWPDGRWGIEFALYDPQTRSTTYRDWRYDPA